MNTILMIVIGIAGMLVIAINIARGKQATPATALAAFGMSFFVMMGLGNTSGSLIHSREIGLPIWIGLAFITLFILPKMLKRV